MVTVHKEKIFAKLIYFLLYAANGSLIPFLNIFLISTGLSITKAGFISGLRNLISCLATPCWSLIREFSKCNRYMFWFSCILSILLISPMPWMAIKITDWNLDASIPSNCSENQKHEVLKRTYSSFESTFKCKDEKSVSFSILFFAMLVLNLTNAIFHLPLTSCIARVTTAYSKEKEDIKKEDQQIFGILGFGLATIFASVLCSITSFETLSDYTPVFLFYCVLMMAVLIVSYFFFTTFQLTKRKQMPLNMRQTSFQLFVSTFSNTRLIMFLISVILVGFSNELVNGFLVIYLNEFTEYKILIGFCVAIGHLIEFFIYPYTNKPVDYFKSTSPTVCITLFINFLKFLSLSFITNAWVVLPIQLLHGISNALFYRAVIKELKIVSLSRMLPIVDSIVHVLFNYVAGTLANIIGGNVYDQFNGKILFRGTSFMYLLWSLVTFIHTIYLLKKNDDDDDGNSDDLEKLDPPVDSLHENATAV